jgi:uncharacterized phage-associated protein
MKTYSITLVKDEAPLLKEVLPFWENYPIDKFLFWNDNCSDDSIDIIKKYLGNRCEIYNSDTLNLNESKGRNFLNKVARSEGADLIFL